jgi:hypothetical protein
MSTTFSWKQRQQKKDPKDDRRQNRNESWEKVTPSHHRSNYDNFRGTPSEFKLKGILNLFFQIEKKS